jgi:hypothetical protein
MPVILATWEMEIGRSWSEPGQARYMRQYLENKRKNGWGLGSSGNRGLNSVPSTTK